MSKVRNFAELAPNIGFSEFDFYDLYRSTFKDTDYATFLAEYEIDIVAEDELDNRIEFIEVKRL